LTAVRLLDHEDTRQVGDNHFLLANLQVLDFDLDHFLLRGLLGFERVQCGVDIIGVRLLDAADRHAVVDARRIYSCRQRVLWQLQTRQLHNSLRGFVVSLTGVLESGPDFFGPASARFPEDVPPVV